MADSVPSYTDSDLATTEKVLAYFLKNVSSLETQEGRFPKLRQLIRSVSTQIEKKDYGGLSRREYITRRLRTAERELKKGREKRLKDLDKAYINNRALREGRLGRLNALTAPPAHLLLGHDQQEEKKDEEMASSSDTSTNDLGRKRKLTQDEKSTQQNKDKARKKYNLKGHNPPDSEQMRELETTTDNLTQHLRDEAEAIYQAEDQELRDKRELFYPRSCYICKKRFYELHHFYDQLCPACAEVNWTKRNQTADLKGKVALLTGSRMKIGFRCGLKLLRCGATLLATTRFPHDAALRYRHI